MRSTALRAAGLVIAAVTTWHLRAWRKIYNDGICSAVGDGEAELAAPNIRAFGRFVMA